MRKVKTNAKANTKIKDPKKVAAGKARAASAIKDKTGKFVSKIFYNEITKTVLAAKGFDVKKISPENTAKISELMKEAEVTKKEIKDFYDRKPKAFERLIDEGEVNSTFKNSDKVEDTINEYSGKLLIDDGTSVREVSKAQAIHALASFKQYMKSHANVVDFAVSMKFNIKGSLSIQIPNANELYNTLKEYFQVSNMNDLLEIDTAEITEALDEIIFDMYGENNIIIYASEKRKRNKKRK